MDASAQVSYHDLQIGSKDQFSPISFQFYHVSSGFVPKPKANAFIFISVTAIRILKSKNKSCSKKKHDF